MYLSYFAGSTTNQRGPWITWLDEIFGVRHTLRYGLVDPIEDDEVTFRFVEDFGDIAAGTTLSFRVGGQRQRSLLPSRRARRRDRGRGRRLTAGPRSCATRSAAARPCSAPIRSSISRRAFPPSTRRRRGACTRRSRRWRACRAPCGSTTRGCSSDRLRTGATERVVFLNCSPDAVVADVIVARGRRPRAAAPRRSGWSRSASRSSLSGTRASAPVGDEERFLLGREPARREQGAVREPGDEVAVPERAALGDPRCVS